jgi:hypothetical protein
MDILRYRSDAWGQQVLEGVSWDLVWVFIAAGFGFIVIHAVYASWRNRLRNRDAAEK